MCGSKTLIIMSELLERDRGGEREREKKREIPDLSPGDTMSVAQAAGARRGTSHLFSHWWKCLRFQSAEPAGYGSTLLTTFSFVHRSCASECRLLQALVCRQTMHEEKTSHFFAASIGRRVQPKRGVWNCFQEVRHCHAWSVPKVFQALYNSLQTVWTLWKRLLTARQIRLRQVLPPS